MPVNQGVPRNKRLAPRRASPPARSGDPRRTPALVLGEVVDDEHLVEMWLEHLDEFLVGRMRQIDVAALLILEGHQEAMRETLGETLGAAREAVEAVKDGRVLFPSYCREGGSSAASAALGKHVRVCVSDPKVGPTHSLRHRMKDRLRLAGVSKADQDILLGHSSGSEGENYGYEEVRLEVAKRALEKALA